jgi:hypothetical protein
MNSAFRSWALKCAFGATCLAALGSTYGWLRYGSPRSVLSVLRGEPLVFEFASLDVHEGNLGDTKDVTAKVTNLSNSPIKLVGSTVSCPCLNVGGLPLELPAGKSHDLTIHVTYFGDGDFTRQIVYFTDCPSQPYLPLTLVGTTSSSTKLRASMPSSNKNAPSRSL